MGVKVERLSETNLELVDLRVKLSPRKGAFGVQYEARAEISFGGDSSDDVRAVSRKPGGVTVDTVELDFDLYDILSLRQTSRVTRASSSKSVRSAQYLGRRLFESLFGRSLGSTYEEARAWSSAKPGRGLRLVLQLPYDDPVVRLPWELLYESGCSGTSRDDFVALGERTAVVRELAQTRSEPLVLGPLVPVEEQPRVLFVAYNDEKLRYDEAWEFEAIRNVLNSYCDVRILSGTEATLERLAREVVSYEPHVVHYLGTGMDMERTLPPGLEPSSGSQAILLRDDQGNRSLVNADELQRLLYRAPYVRFVFLNACNTDWVAATLGRGVPAVIGVLGEYADTSAIALARSFYSECGHGAALEQALAIARRELNYSNPGSLEWSAPVLYMTHVGSTLVRVRPSPLIRLVVAPQPAVVGVEAMVTQTGRDAEREYLAARLEVDRRNRFALEEQILQLGSQVPPAVQAQLDQLRQRIAETEAALGVKQP